MSGECIAITKNGKGKRCTRQANPGSPFCWQHQGYTGPTANNIAVTQPVIVQRRVPVPLSVRTPTTVATPVIVETKQYSPPQRTVIAPIVYEPIEVKEGSRVLRPQSPILIKSNPGRVVLQSPVEVKQQSPKIVYAPVAAAPVVTSPIIVAQKSPRNKSPIVLAAPSGNGYLKTDSLSVSAPLDGSLDDMDEEARYDTYPEADSVWGHGPFKIELELDLANNKRTVDFILDKDYTLREIINALTDAYTGTVSISYLRDALARADPDQVPILTAFLEDAEAGESISYWELNAGAVFVEGFDMIRPGVYNAVLGS